jgi:hypothetical protein
MLQCLVINIICTNSFFNLKQDGGSSSSEVAPAVPLLDYDYDKDHMAAHMEHGPMDE